MLTTISTVFWENVLSRYRFSTQGATQLHADMLAVCRVVDKHVGPGVAEAGLRKCLEGVRLVGLPVKGSPSTAGQDGAKHDDGGEENEDWDTEAWGAEDGDEGVSGAEKAIADDKATSLDAGDGAEELGLWEVEKRLFADNQAARDVLDELGLELLSETEARSLLRRRVELAG